MKLRDAQKIVTDRWPKAVIRHRPDAPSADERKRMNARRAEIKVRTEEIDLRLKAINYNPSTLREAARFVVDVNGDDPSIQLMAEVLDVAEEHAALLQERSDLRRERESMRDHRYRYEIAIGREWCIEITHYADTLDELMERVRAKAVA